MRPLGPSLRAPLLTTLISLAVAVALLLGELVLAGPHLADLFRIIGNSGPSDSESIRAPIMTILSPGMFLVSLVTGLAAITFFVASLWLLIAIIIRLSRR